MLDLEVVPELALRCRDWELVLGMPLQQAIEIIRKQDSTITNVDFWHSDKFPFAFNMIISLQNDGLRLHFEPHFQRLMLIEITDMSKISLSYWSQRFNGPNKMPTLQEIIRVFGSTKQLLPDESVSGNYRLCYRGITFVLSAPSREDGGFATPVSPGSCSLASTSSAVADLSRLDASDINLFVKRIYLFLGQNVSEAKPPSQLPSSCYHGNIFLERLRVLRSGERTKKLAFDLIYQELCVNPNRDPPIQRFSACVAFGDTVQDVLSALGSPSRIFYKTEDKMKIHLPQSYRQIRQRHSDFFYNYFTLGLDVLFDSHTHTVISFVLHTNLPGEYTFNTYYRCMFEIPLEEVEGGKGLTVTPFTKWSEIKLHLLDAIDAEPVVIHRETKPPKNPYGSTHAYGYQDIIFEVLPQNDYLGSVTLFSLPKNM
uniref:Uncharacterized protein n=1 Tax=Schistocephalus solidus TaxID=70667 RepID=A0A0V0JB53_SCHSO